jgi:hypothetical protein
MTEPQLDAVMAVWLAVTAGPVDCGHPPLRSPIRWAAATRDRRVGATSTTTRGRHGGSLSPRRGDHGLHFSS